MGRRVGKPRGTSKYDESSVKGLRKFRPAVKILELPSKMITGSSDVRLILDADVGISGLAAFARRLRVKGSLKGALPGF
jgi:molybdopterin/thiamine biosynthesis adenylyltransferase